MQKKEIKKRTANTLSFFSSERVQALHVREFSKKVQELHNEHLTLIFQQSTTPLNIKIDNRPYAIDFENIQLVSKGKITDFSSSQGVFHFFALFFLDSAINEAIIENKVSKIDQQTLQNLNQSLLKTPWLTSLLKQYFYETVIMLDSPPGCTFFLEKQIINEVMRCLFANYYMKNDALDKILLDSQTFEIVKYIETHLHEENFSIAKIAMDSGLSESSLLRKFKASFGTSPQSYIKNRRLEDAYHFIKEHKMSIGEACFMVGYSDFASFTKSFKNKFGILPSHL